MIKVKFKLFKEMSISDEKISKNRKNIFSDIKNYKIVSIYMMDKILELKNELLNIEKIKFRKFEYSNNRIYTKVAFTDKIEFLIGELQNILYESKGLEVYDKYFSILYPDNNELNFSTEIQIEENYLNRIHVPLGLPYILKGIGLGKKIYKSLLQDIGYISTSRLDRTIDAVFVWDSLRKDIEIYTFINGENVLCIDSNKNYDYIIKILEKFYKNLNKDIIILDDDFKNKYKDFYVSHLKYLLKYEL